MLRHGLLLFAVLVGLAGAPHSAVAAPAPPVYVHDNRVVYGPFFSFFRAHGGAAAFGVPLTDAYVEPASGLKVQLFTYARMELHGRTILLSRLGSVYAGERSADPAFGWRTAEATLPGYRFFPESGHTLGGAFGWYHAQHGGVALLGYPISEEFYELQPDGSPVLVQYFERAVLRYEPVGGGMVQRLPLGVWAAAFAPSEQRTAPPQLRPLATEKIAYAAGTADGVNIELAAERINGSVVEPGAVLSFLHAIGEISTETGYRRGNAIVGGQIVASEVGGGICTIATLLYRAAWAGGLPIVERRAHRYALRAYADAPGYDAAVYAPGQDLRIANPTGAPIFVGVIAAHGTATLTLWGRGDGRAVELRPPQITNNGLTVWRSRTIRLADGRQWREQVTTRYAPLPPSAFPGPAAEAEQAEPPPRQQERS
jgi:hypothetical protein